MKNSFGSAVRATVFGESHGTAIGAVLDGLAPGIVLDEEYIAFEMEKRRASGSISTARREADRVTIVSGYYNGRTTGTPLCLMIENADVKSEAYDGSLRLPRPGHADYAGHAKYCGFEDPRGGGHFSGRVTAAVVAAGAVCRAALSARGITVGTHIARCADVADSPLPQEEHALKAALDALNRKLFAVLDERAERAMRAAIEAARADGDSVGGILETAVTGLPAGVGEPFFESMESVLSALFFSIPAVKGVEFGAGFGFAAMRGSAANDAFCSENGAVRTRTNHNGGINGGITNGMPLIARMVVKPTPSIAKKQDTVDLQTGETAVLAVKGRHDPCIVHRARAVADAMAAIGVLDLCTQRFGTLWQAGLSGTPGTGWEE